MSGSFLLFGHRQELVFGGNYQKVDGGGRKSYPSALPAPIPVDVFNFNPADPIYREPASPAPTSWAPENGQQQWGVYTNARLTPLERLHVISGLRYSHFAYRRHSQRLDPVTGEVVPGHDRRESYGDDDFSWPPAYALVYDLTRTWSAYASYSDIYRSQADFIDHAGDPIRPLVGSNIEAGVKLESLSGRRLNAALSAYRITHSRAGSCLPATPTT